MSIVGCFVSAYLLFSCFNHLSRDTGNKYCLWWEHFITPLKESYLPWDSSCLVGIYEYGDNATSRKITINYVSLFVILKRPGRVRFTLIYLQRQFSLPPLTLTFRECSDITNHKRNKIHRSEKYTLCFATNVKCAPEIFCSEKHSYLEKLAQQVP